MGNIIHCGRCCEFFFDISSSLVCIVIFEWSQKKEARVESRENVSEERDDGPGRQSHTQVTIRDRLGRFVPRPWQQSCRCCSCRGSWLFAKAFASSYSVSPITQDVCDPAASFLPLVNNLLLGSFNIYIYRERAPSQLARCFCNNDLSRPENPLQHAPHLPIVFGIFVFFRSVTTEILP